jgi:ABC-type proline/glycine betaine transport system permease subunit
VIERFLILSFILINQWAAIGFLLAAKSIFRFGDLKEGKYQKKTEYILIGTLMSFSIALVHGLILRYLMNNIW